MPRFMLDTDTVSYAMRGHGNVGERLRDHHPSEVCISSITLAELRFGAEARRASKLHRAIDVFVSNVLVEPFDDEAAHHFGIVGAALAKVGAPIGQLDTLIAAHALSVGAVLVTNNVKHFERVAGLRTENWA
jgi:tRNA(fMet)-specific endonuclease VapC